MRENRSKFFSVVNQIHYSVKFYKSKILKEVSPNINLLIVLNWHFFSSRNIFKCYHVFSISFTWLQSSWLPELMSPFWLYDQRSHFQPLLFSPKLTFVIAFNCIFNIFWQLTTNWHVSLQSIPYDYEIERFVFKRDPHFGQEIQIKISKRLAYRCHTHICSRFSKDNSLTTQLFMNQC